MRFWKKLSESPFRLETRQSLGGHFFLVVFVDVDEVERANAVWSIRFGIRNRECILDRTCFPIHFLIASTLPPLVSDESTLKIAKDANSIALGHFQGFGHGSPDLSLDRPPRFDHQFSVA